MRGSGGVPGDLGMSGMSRRVWGGLGGPRGLRGGVPGLRDGLGTGLSPGAGLTPKGPVGAGL